MLSLVLTMCQLFPSRSSPAGRTAPGDDAHHGAARRRPHLVAHRAAQLRSSPPCAPASSSSSSPDGGARPLRRPLRLGAISFAFLLSASNAVLAAVVGPIAFFGALPRYSSSAPIGTSASIKSLRVAAAADGLRLRRGHPGTMRVGGRPLEQLGAGRLLLPDVPHDDALDTVLYAVLGLYLERVPPPSMARASPTLLPHARGGVAGAGGAARRGGAVRAVLSSSPRWRRDADLLAAVGRDCGVASVRQRRLEDRRRLLHVAFYAGQIRVSRPQRRRDDDASVLTGLYPPTGDRQFGLSVRRAALGRLSLLASARSTRALATADGASTSPSMRRSRACRRRSGAARSRA